MTTNGNGSWRRVPLGSLARFINGRAFSPSEWSSVGLPIIRIQNLTDMNAPANLFQGELEPKHRVDTGDVLVSWSASLDAFLWTRGPAALNQHIFKVDEDAARVDRHFLYFALRATMTAIRAQVHGSTMQHITKPAFEATEVSIPVEIERQQALAQELASKLDGAQRVRDAAIAQREALFATSGALLHATLARIHGGAVEEAPLGSIPTRVQYGSSSPSNREGRGLPMLRMGNIVEGRISYENMVHVELDENDAAKWRLHRGDILVTRTSGSANLVGKTGLFDRTGDYVFASYLIRLQPDQERCLPEYLHAVLNSSIGRRYIDKVKHQVGQFNINATDLKGFRVPLPAVDIQEAALAELRQAAPVLDKMLAAADEAVIAARALPDALLREVFQPEVPYKEIDEEPDDGE